MTLSNKVKDIAGLIGEFYLQKNNGNYAAAEHEIRKLNITELSISITELTDDAKVVITLGRPGLIIGRKGENYEKLAQFLRQTAGYGLEIMEAKEQLLDYLIPYNPEVD